MPDTPCVACQQVAATGSLEPYTQELAQVLDLPAWIFQPARLQGSGFSQPLPQGGFQGALPQEHQTPQSLPHLPAHVYQQAAWTEDLGSLPADDSSPPETEQAGQFPAAPAGRFAAAPVRQFLTLQAEQPPVSPQGHFSAPQAGQFAAALAGLSAAGPETAPYPGDWAEYEGPSSNGNHYDQQAQPDLGLWIDPLATQGNSIRDLYAAATCNPSSALLGDRQGLSTENGPNSPDEVHMPYTASAQPTPLVLEEASPAGSCQSMPASTVLQQSHSSMDVWTPHPKLASGMQQGLHASGQEPPGLVQGLQPGTSGLGPGSFVFRGRPTQPSGRDRGFMHSQSEKVKRHPLSRTPSFAAGPGTAVTASPSCLHTLHLVFGHGPVAFALQSMRLCSICSKALWQVNANETYAHQLHSISRGEAYPMECSKQAQHELREGWLAMCGHCMTLVTSGTVSSASQ